MIILQKAEDVDDVPALQGEQQLPDFVLQQLRPAELGRDDPSRTELLGHEDRQLLLALQRRDVISICSFLDDYRGFATTDEVLDLLFTE